MALPDTIIVEEINVIDTVTVSPVEEINSISVNTVQDVDVVHVDVTNGVETIALVENAPPLVVQVSNIENTAMVRSVNGKTGHVVIDYPDINTSPVNHVKYVHTQVNVPIQQFDGTYQWNITHNLGFFPNVTILNNAVPPEMVEADVRYLDTNSVRIIMNTGMSGTAYLT